MSSKVHFCGFKNVNRILRIQHGFYGFGLKKKTPLARLWKRLDSTGSFPASLKTIFRIDTSLVRYTLEPVAPIQATRKGGVPVTMSSLRILIVEDYEAFRKFIRSAVEERVDLQVIGEVSDGLEAVQKAVQLQPDLILLDMGLPQLNGLEAARRISELSPNSKIVFLTQESSSDVVHEAFRIGALGYVQKLHAKTDLLPAIDAVLASKRFVSKGLEFGDSVPTQAPHRHEILFCSNDAVLIDNLARFIGAALSIGNPALVLIAESHRDMLIQTLQAQGVDLDAAIRQGTYLSLNADEPPDPVQFFEIIKALSEAAAKAGQKHPRVAFCGERAGRLWAAGKTDEAIQLERVCEDLANDQDVDILCVYPLLPGQEDDPKLKRTYAEHTTVTFR